MTIARSGALRTFLATAAFIALPVYSSMKGVGAVVTALYVANMADDRSFLKRTLVNADTLLVAVVALTSGSLFAAFRRLTALVVVAINAASWLMTAALAVTAIALPYAIPRAP